MRPRARRRALITTSVAELLKRTRSAGHHGLQALGDVDLEFRLRGPVRAEPGLRGDGVGQAGRRVAEEQRALAGLEVDVFVAVHVPQARAAAAREVERHRVDAVMLTHSSYCSRWVTRSAW